MLPETTIFNGLYKPRAPLQSARCYFRCVEVREPVDGEWFIPLKGSKANAYKAPNVEPPSLGDCFIVEPTFYAVTVSTYVPGEPVKWR